VQLCYACKVLSIMIRRALLSLLACFPLLATAAQQPNVVIFVSDDMGWNDVGYHGSKVQTPNIDRLAKEGVQLDRFYVFPICSPTRTALMTGRSPIRFGIINALGGSGGVPPNEHFMPKAFQAAGYQTVMVGKWHLGATGEEYSPQKRGFDHFYGFRGGVIDYYTHKGRGQLDWQRNGKTIDEKGYSTELFATEAVRMIENRDKKKPLFLYMPFNAPHGPAQAPEAAVEKYNKLGVGGRVTVRAASIDVMDVAIGKVLAALEKEGMTKNTIAMFFCDNGAGGGRERGGSGARPGRPAEGGDDGTGNTPLRGGKGSVLEGGVRVPAVIRWPGVIKAGSKTSQLIAVQDLLPTLTAAVGIPHGNDQKMDGANVWPAIKEGKTVERPPVVIAASRGMTILQDQWKLIKAGGTVTLYDVVADPLESADLASKEPELVAKLSQSMAPFAKMLADNPGRSPRGRRTRRGGAQGQQPSRRGPGQDGAQPDGEGRPPRGNRPGRPGARPRVRPGGQTELPEKKPQGEVEEKKDPAPAKEPNRPGQR
jgi:arylsulfatase A-like enzyme